MKMGIYQVKDDRIELVEMVDEAPPGINYMQYYVDKLDDMNCIKTDNDGELIGIITDDSKYFATLSKMDNGLTRASFHNGTIEHIA